MLQIFRKYKIGLCLSGGGARGIAHLGVLQYLNENKQEPSVISGVSAGSLAAAFYADGYSPHEILDLFISRKLYQLMRLAFPRTGFMKVNGLKDILKKNLRAKSVEDLNIPIIITATNFSEGRVEYFSKGNLVDHLLASTSIPVLFEIKEKDQTYYIDGGVMDNLPVKPLEDKCRKLIAVHVNPIGKISKVTSPIQVAERAFHLSIASETENKREMVDIFLEPPLLTNYGMLEIKKARDIFDVGYNYAAEYLGK